MKIKDPTLLYKSVHAEYEVDVEGTKVPVTYRYDMNDEQAGGWQYDLSPCFVDLTDDEIADLEEEFASVILELKV
jgi:hypothetical protein